MGCCARLRFVEAVLTGRIPLELSPFPPLLVDSSVQYQFHDHCKLIALAHMIVAQTNQSRSPINSMAMSMLGSGYVCCVGNVGVRECYRVLPVLQHSVPYPRLHRTSRHKGKECAGSRLIFTVSRKCLGLC